MEEKMKGLDKIITEVDTYCNDNKIEYVFSAVAEGGKHVRISHNSITNAVLKEASKVFEILVKK